MCTHTCTYSFRDLLYSVMIGSRNQSGGNTDEHKEGAITESTRSGWHNNWCLSPNKRWRWREEGREVREGDGE